MEDVHVLLVRRFTWEYSFSVKCVSSGILWNSVIECNMVELLVPCSRIFLYNRALNIILCHSSLGAGKYHCSNDACCRIPWMGYYWIKSSKYPFVIIFNVARDSCHNFVILLIHVAFHSWSRNKDSLCSTVALWISIFTNILLFQSNLWKVQ